MTARNLPLLATCQMISATGTIALVTLGGIIGAELTGDKALATLPVAMMVVTLAAATVPASLLMRAIGRRRGFVLASLLAAAAVLLAVYALSAESFAWFVTAAAVFGINGAFAQQYRYAAAESVEPAHAARAISLVLLGAIGGAIVGPELVRLGEHLVEDLRHAGTLYAMALLYGLQAGLFLFLQPLHAERHGGDARGGRPLKTIVRQPLFVIAVLAGTVAYGAMTLIMTGTPLSMHVDEGYSLGDTAQVIRSHVLGMYVPSLFSGWLVERVGLGRMMATGVAALVLACLVGLQGQTLMHYGLALVVLGVGWNFLYVGGTTMLTLSYSMAERYRAQAANELCVFGTAAAASLLAGSALHWFGWRALMLIPLPALLLTLAGLFIVRNEPGLRRRAGSSAA